jgi:hypothetical protein
VTVLPREAIFHCLVVLQAVPEVQLSCAAAEVRALAPAVPFRLDLHPALKAVLYQ